MVKISTNVLLESEIVDVEEQFATRIDNDHSVSIERMVLRDALKGIAKIYWQEVYKFNQAYQYSNEKVQSEMNLKKLRLIRKDLSHLITDSYKSKKLQTS